MQKLNQPKSVHQDTFLFPHWRVVHEYNAHGCHRLRCHCTSYRSDFIQETAWHKYEELVMFEVPGMPEYRSEYFVATTAYWQGIFPSGVFRTEAGERL